MNKFRSSWELCKTSAVVVFQNRKLLLFPILNSAFIALIAFFFLAPIAVSLIAYPTGYHWNQKEHWLALDKHYFHNDGHPMKPHPAAANPNAALATLTHNFLYGPADGKPDSQSSMKPLPIIYCGGLYFLSMFLATFFNVAFYSEIMAALNGQPVSFRRGFAVARNRLPSILAWSLMAGVIGWVIRRIEDRLPLIGRLVVGLIGLAWSVAAVFAIPVIIQESSVRNPLKILKQSALTLKRTWGEGLIGFAGNALGEGVILIASLGALAVLIALAMIVHSWLLGVILVGLWVMALAFAFYVLGVGGQVFRCALYIYAAEGVIPAPYTRELMDSAWKIK